MSNRFFGVIPVGQPVVTEPVSLPSAASFIYRISATLPISHVVVFILPGAALPPNTAAAIYVAPAPVTSTGHLSGFRFLGGVGLGKESSIYSIHAEAAGYSGIGAAVSAPTDFLIGISIEEAETVASRIQARDPEYMDRGLRTSTIVLAQNIIQNAFNFLSGFSGKTGPAGVEVVPLKAFQDWWKKFEARVRSDPSFLERPQD